jgi:hypothetical protein
MASILPAHGTCEKNERGFCSSSRYEKNLSRFLKIHLHLPRIASGKTLVKMAVLSFGGRAVFFLGSGIPDPP